MVLNDEEIKERVESPLNLLNRLRRAAADKPNLPCMPKSSDVMDDLENKIKHGSIRSKAAGIMSDALDELKMNISSMKPEKLAQVVREMNTVVTSREERERGDKMPQIVVYAPQTINENSFETVVVRE